MNRYEESKCRRRRLRQLRFEPLEDRRVLATITVTSLDDAGPGTLRQAVLEANAFFGPDDIVFESSLTGGTINLLTEIDVIGEVRIDASSIGGINIDLSTADPTPGVADGMGIRAFDIDFQKVTICQLTISGGDVAGEGGAIRAFSDLEVLNSTLSDNSTGLSGGAIFAYRTLTIAGTTISGNSGHFGGALFAGIQGGPVGAWTLTVTDSTISGNSAESDGGAIFVTYHGLSIQGSTISGNSAGGDGGAISAGRFGGARAGSVTVMDSTISGNSAGSTGGAIFAYSYSTLTIGGSTISGNSAGNVGGAIDAVETVTVTGSTISGNSAGLIGGAIFARSTLNIEGSTVSGNSAANDGGGLFIPSGTVEDSTISDNQSNERGGGLRVGLGSLPPVRLERVTIANNYAARGGGGVSVDSQGSLQLSNTTISGNSTAGAGGGIQFDDFPGNTHTIQYSTIAGNTANVDGALPVDSGGGVIGVESVRFHNTVIADNLTMTGATALPEDIAGSFSSFDYTLVEANSLGVPIIGSGNILGIDPLLAPLADNGGPTLTHAVLPLSPALDAGDPDFAPPPNFDQRGDPFARVFGSRIDIGSFESQPFVVDGDFNDDGLYDCSGY